jgi:hypothetical protein
LNIGRCEPRRSTRRAHRGGARLTPPRESLLGWARSLDFRHHDHGPVAPETGKFRPFTPPAAIIRCRYCKRLLLRVYCRAVVRGASAPGTGDFSRQGSAPEARSGQRSKRTMLAARSYIFEGGPLNLLRNTASIAARFFFPIWLIATIFVLPACLLTDLVAWQANPPPAVLLLVYPIVWVATYFASFVIVGEVSDICLGGTASFSRAIYKTSVRGAGRLLGTDILVGLVVLAAMIVPTLASLFIGVLVDDHHPPGDRDRRRRRTSVRLAVFVYRSSRGDRTTLLVFSTQKKRINRLAIQRPLAGRFWLVRSHLIGVANRYHDDLLH